ncbi:HNH/endonuclease VII fold putative polymorphic toxin, partial [Pantoea sp. SIMBA_133]
PMLDESRNRVMTREYQYSRLGRSTVIIQDHGAGHIFSETSGDQGPHFNVRPISNTNTGSIEGTHGHYNF